MGVVGIGRKLEPKEALRWNHPEPNTKRFEGSSAERTNRSDERTMVQEALTVLIADRNPHVREFLRRELLNEGYRVLTAKNGREVLKQVYRPGPLDALVLDLDLPDTNGTDLLDMLQDRIPSLPLVLHTFAPADGSREDAFTKADAFVEKRGNSVDRLKKVLRELLSAGEKRGPDTKEPGPFPDPPGGGLR